MFQRNRIDRIVGALVVVFAFGTAACGAPDDSEVADAPVPPGGVEIATPETTESAVAPAAPEPSAALRCAELSAAEDWSAALAPCQAAFDENPHDPIVQSALARAKANTRESIE